MKITGENKFGLIRNKRKEKRKKRGGGGNNTTNETRVAVNKLITNS